jgi:hypothetical protein
MKKLKKVTKILKIFKTILWLIFAFIILLLLYWLLKFDWSSKQYISFLNGRNWSVEVQKVNLAKPVSLFDIFLQPKKEVISTWNQNTLIDSQTGIVWSLDTNLSWDLDVYDPNFQEDFNEYFDGWSNSWDDIVNKTNVDEFWFKKE